MAHGLVQIVIKGVEQSVRGWCMWRMGLEGVASPESHIVVNNRLGVKHCSE